jgi:glycogen(starch) synthase
MRVIYWTELFWPHIGGVEVFSRQLITALQKRGHEITVLTSLSDLGTASEERVDGIQIKRLPFQQVIAKRDLKPVHELTNQVVALFRQIQPDLIHINSSQPSILIYHLSHASSSIPTLFTIHEPPSPAEGANSLVGRTMLEAKRVAAVSQASLSQARQLVPAIAPHSSVIYNGLEMPPAPIPRFVSDPPSLLCIGRLIKEKGFDLAIQALGEIRKVFPEVRLVIAGDGRERQPLEQQVEGSGMNDAVEFTGWCQPEKIPALIEAATIVLIPSRWEEPFGLVALQAAQRARPVIAARTGGIPEVVVHGETGLLFEKENPTELAQQVIHLLRHPETAERMGKRAWKRAQRLFSLERAASEYDALYKDIGQGGSPVPATGRQT